MSPMSQTMLHGLAVNLRDPLEIKGIGLQQHATWTAQERWAVEF